MPKTTSSILKQAIRFVDAVSEEFDTLVTLMDANGLVVNENDDGPELFTPFARINESGKYTVRVRSYAGDGEGPFSVKLARLRDTSQLKVVLSC